MSDRRNDKQIEELLNRLDGSGSEGEWLAVEELRKSLEMDFAAYLLSRFRTARRWNVRSSCVYHATRYARESAEAVELGKEAIRDKSKVVRYRGCLLLAYSLRSDLLPELRSMLDEIPADTRDDILAAIDALENRNHHYFIDREHSGQIKLNIE